MKYLLVLIVVVVGLWLLIGKSRRSTSTPDKPDKRPAVGTDVMVRCSHCGVHLPDADAIAGDGARRYCSDAHRLAGPR